jgi:hypothetical protein
LPSAIFVLGPLPHPGAANLVSRCNYRLRALPFAEALHITRNHIYGASIPAGMYRLDPPEPATTLPTIGTQLLLVSNKDVPDTVVEKLLQATLETSFSHLYDPPLDIGQLSLVPEYPQHPGVAAYLASREPVTFEALTTASKLLAVVTGAIPFTMVLLRVFSQWRQRDRMVSVRQLIAQATLIERGARELEHAPGPVAETAASFRAQLLQLRSTALDKSSARQLRDVELLPSFLDYVAETMGFLDRLIREPPRAPTTAQAHDHARVGTPGHTAK